MNPLDNAKAVCLGKSRPVYPQIKLRVFLKTKRFSFSQLARNAIATVFFFAGLQALAQTGVAPSQTSSFFDDLRQRSKNFRANAVDESAQRTPTRGVYDYSSGEYTGEQSYDATSGEQPPMGEDAMRAMGLLNSRSGYVGATKRGAGDFTGSTMSPYPSSSSFFAPAYANDPFLSGKRNIKLGPLNIGLGMNTSLEYNDNITQAHEDQLDDMIAAMYLNVDANWQITERNRLSLTTSLGVDHYFNHPEKSPNGKDYNFTVFPGSTLSFDVGVGEIHFVLYDRVSVRPSSRSEFSLDDKHTFGVFENDIGIAANWAINSKIVLSLNFNHSDSTALEDSGNTNNTGSDSTNSTSTNSTSGTTTTTGSTTTTTGSKKKSAATTATTTGTTGTDATPSASTSATTSSTTGTKQSGSTATDATSATTTNSKKTSKTSLPGDTATDRTIDSLSGSLAWTPGSTYTIGLEGSLSWIDYVEQFNNDGTTLSYGVFFASPITRNTLIKASVGLQQFNFETPPAFKRTVTDADVASIDKQILANTEAQTKITSTKAVTQADKDAQAQQLAPLQKQAEKLATQKANAQGTILAENQTELGRSQDQTSNFSDYYYNVTIFNQLNSRVSQQLAFGHESSSNTSSNFVVADYASYGVGVIAWRGARFSVSGYYEEATDSGGRLAETTVQYGVDTLMTHRLTEHLTLGLGYHRGTTDSEEVGRDYLQQSYSADLSYAFNAKMNLGFGYRFIKTDAEEEKQSFDQSRYTFSINYNF